MSYQSLLKNEIYLKDDTLITSKTDQKGRVTYGNADFCRYVGYSEPEFLGHAHSFCRHKFMPKIAFKLLWDTLNAGREFFAFVCNSSRSGSHYWVFANITPSYDASGRVIGYYSVRRRASKAGVEAMLGVYDKLLELESSGGMEASGAFALDFLAQNNTSWDELILGLQKQGEKGGYR